MANFAAVPSVYPQLLELRKSKTAQFKPIKYLKPTTVLRYYQVVGALHMILLDRMVLGDATGIGKSVQGITAYASCLERDPTLKLLVVCPKSALYQWPEEFEKFTTGISVRAVTNKYKKLEGFQARKLQYQEFKENVLVMGYAPLREEFETVAGILGSNFMVIYDEATAFKNRKSATHGACKLLSEKASRVYGMSATIIKNGLEEVYGIYDVIVPGLFGRITKFKTTYCKQEMMKLVINGKKRQIPKVVGYKNLTQFKQVIDPYFLSRKKEDVASELPKLISREVIVEMFPEQKKLYREALSGIVYEEKVKHEFFEVSDLIRGGVTDKKILDRYTVLKEKYDKFMTEEGKKRGKLAAITYCQMVSNGPRLLNQNSDSSKEEEFARLMVEELATEKVIVYTRFKSGLPFLEVICEHLKLKYVKITGDSDDGERKQVRHKFQDDPTVQIMFITNAGSAALNLQAASVIIFYDTPWSYGDLVQVIGRAQRIGSLREHILLIHLINKHTVDMRVMKRVSGKKGLSDAVIGDTAAGALVFNENEESAIDDLFQGLMEDAKEDF